jgi:hypothetical protein
VNLLELAFLSGPQMSLRRNGGIYGDVVNHNTKSHASSFFYARGSLRGNAVLAGCPARPQRTHKEACRGNFRWLVGGCLTPIRQSSP